MSAVIERAAPPPANVELAGVAGDPLAGASRLARTGRVLKRSYERLCSAIFDPDGDVMRL